MILFGLVLQWADGLAGQRPTAEFHRRDAIAHGYRTGAGARARRVTLGRHDLGRSVVAVRPGIGGEALVPDEHPDHRGRRALQGRGDVPRGRDSRRVRGAFFWGIMASMVSGFIAIAFLLRFVQHALVHAVRDLPHRPRHRGDRDLRHRHPLTAPGPTRRAQAPLTDISPTSRVMPAAPPGSQVRSAPTCDDVVQHALQRRRDRDLAHRLGELAVAHHEAVRADREVAAHRVGAGVQPADRLHVERFGTPTPGSRRRSSAPGTRCSARRTDTGWRLEPAAHRGARRARTPRGARCTRCAGTRRAARRR